MMQRAQFFRVNVFCKIMIWRKSNPDPSFVSKDSDELRAGVEAIGLPTLK